MQEILEPLRIMLGKPTSDQRIYVAYSGGVDSHVLLHACAALAEYQPFLTAVYVHHGLQQVADDWMQHCAKQCQQLAVPFIWQKVNATANSGESPEEAARNARYQCFKSLLKADELLLTGQHREDQMETMMLQLFRGAGLAGLAGMPPRTSLGDGCLLRPFLNVAKKDILAYAKQHGLQWVEDPTNQVNDFDRNFLRNRVIPEIKQRWPSVDKTIARSASHCAQASQLINMLAEDGLRQTYDESKQSLNLVVLKTHNKESQKLIIRSWFKALRLRMPSTKLLQRLLDEVVYAKLAANPEMHIQNSVIHRYRQQLFCIPKTPPIDLNTCFDWKNKDQALNLPENGSLLAVLGKTPGIDVRVWRDADVQVRYRHGGESMRLPGRDGQHSLKKIFQEYAVPPWIRKQIPLIYIDGHLAALANICIDARFSDDAVSDHISLQWQQLGFDRKPQS